MDHYEMVEKLRQKANVSYEEAKEALEKTDWDILDALVLLESEGKVKMDSTTYTTEEKPVASSTARKQNASSTWHRVCEFILNLLRKSCDNNFVISRKGEEKLAFPLIALALLFIFAFPFTVCLLIVGLFCGYKYNFRGPDFGSKVNEAMDKAANFAQELTGQKKDIEVHAEIKDADDQK